jgi:SpoIID/LytB domain protein
MRKWLILLLVILAGIFWSHQVKAEDCGTDISCLEREQQKLSEAMQQSIAATRPLEAELDRLQQRLDSINAGIQKAKDSLRALEASIAEREAEFSVQYALLSERVLSFYKASRAPSSFFVLFTSGSKSNLARDLFYQQVVTDRDKDEIAQISQDLIQLERDKQKVEADRVRLANLQVKVDKEAKFFEGEIAGAKAYQKQLSLQISALQQKIIAQKLGSLNLPQSLGAGPLMCTDDRNLNPGFSGFAFFTYGIPHRVGMNQYGAKGRAASQNAEQILRAYFQNFDFSGGFEGRSVVVNGKNEFGQEFNNESMNIEEYLKHIHEMPTSWPASALQAQAIAARSYALAEMDAKGFVYPSQKDQVIKKEINSNEWLNAVSTTNGRAMTQGGKPIKAWYSSTSGGYTFSAADVWGGDRPWTKRLQDTTGGINSFDDLMNKSFDKESKCFYAAQGWRDKYAKSAWLTREEVADIANVILLVKKKPETACFVYQPDQPAPAPDRDCPKTDNWSADKVKQELGSEAISTANSVEISGVDWGIGKTTQVRINGISFGGDEFKNYFNVRAPANIQIVGPLYNVERR